MAIPHLSLPLRLVDGQFATVEQDTVEDILQCVRVVLTTPEGFREELPDFGLPDQTFLQGGADTAVIEETIAEWEPRADAQVYAFEDLGVGCIGCVVGDAGVQVADLEEGGAGGGIGHVASLWARPRLALST